MSVSAGGWGGDGGGGGGDDDDDDKEMVMAATRKRRGRRGVIKCFFCKSFGKIGNEMIKMSILFCVDELA